MRTSRSPRIVWTLATGVAGVGLLGSAAVAAALSNAPAVPARANAHVTLSSSDDSSSSDSSSSDSSSSESSSSESSSSESGSPSSTPVGPDATGPAAYGLCNAYEHAKVHGKSVIHSIAFRNLAAAAGGVDGIDAYCATIPHPGSSDASSSESESESDAPPSSVPSPSHPTGRPSGIPSHSHPTRP